MDKNKDTRYVSPSGTRSSLKSKIFEYYVYAVLVWVHLALAFDIYMIIKHFNEL
jgi:hypothetical protein